MFSSPSSSTGVTARSTGRSGSLDKGCGTAVCAVAETSSIARSQRSRSLVGSLEGSLCSRVASSDRGDGQISRFSRGQAGSGVLVGDDLALLGDLDAPSRVPDGWARIASWVGPPPRPTVPPRPWNSRSRDAVRGGARRAARAGRGGSPTARW